MLFTQIHSTSRIRWKFKPKLWKCIGNLPNR